MTRRMLINAQNREELRIATVTGSVLQDFQLEVTERGLSRGNIYRGIVNNIQPSLNAVFVNFGGTRDGFLSVQDVVDAAWHRQPKGGRRPRIDEVLERGKPLLVQVSRDPEGQKGAALTTNVSLAGRYLVFTPYDETHGVSRKVEDEDERRKLKEQTATLKVPDGGGFIVRTNALDQTKTTLAKDFAALTRLWKGIQTSYAKGSGPQLLHNDQDIIIRTLRDYLDPTIEEVLIDDEAAFLEAEDYVRSFMQRSKVRLVRYADREPLFSRFGVEKQIDRIYERSVPLPSGGSIVIDRTEALTAIDVNSGKSTRAHTQEETALNTNIEASREVARQLRLRDIGGLVVVDFIDMRSSKHRQNVEKSLREEMKIDKARTTIGKISPNGLLEVNRQRIQQALHLRTHRPCPTCSGTGRIASPEMVGLNLLRRIQARASTTPLKHVRIALHPELADAFQNGRRRDIAELEREFDMRIEVIASNRLHRPEQEVEWFEGEIEPAPVAATVVPTSTPKWPASKPSDTSQPPAAEGNGKRKRRRRKKHGDVSQLLTGVLAPVAPNLSEPTGQEEGFEDRDFEIEEDDASLEQPAEAETGEAAAADGSKRPRRRRRGRRRRHSGEPEVQLVNGMPPEHTEDEPIPDLPDNLAPMSSFWLVDEPEEELPVRPVAPSPDEEDEEEEASWSVLEEDQESAAPTSQADAAPSAGARKRKRRRRRRGSAANGAEAGASAEVALDHSSEAPRPDALPLDVANADEELEEESQEEAVTPPGARPRKRRRRRRSSPATAGEAAGPSEALTITPAAEPEPSAAAPARKRRPRRAPRKKSGEPAAEDPSS